MNIRIPRTGTAAKIAKTFLKSQGLAVTHSQALELIARLHGYQTWQALESDVRFVDAPALKPVSSHEYELQPNEHSAWIGVDGISVSVTRNDEGVTVDLYAKGREDNSLAGTSLFFHEAQEVLEDEEDFEPMLVDWAKVADNDEIDWLRINDNPARQIVNTDRTLLRRLAELKLLNKHPELTKKAAFEFTIVEALGRMFPLPLGHLTAAMETSPGEIYLLNGLALQLLVSDEDGTQRVYSPALDRLI